MLHTKAKCSVPMSKKYLHKKAGINPAFFIYLDLYFGKALTVSVILKTYLLKHTA